MQTAPLSRGAVHAFRAEYGTAFILAFKAISAAVKARKSTPASAPARAEQAQA